MYILGNIDCSLWQGAVVIGGYLPVSQASSDRFILFIYFFKKKVYKSTHFFSRVQTEAVVLDDPCRDMNTMESKNKQQRYVKACGRM